MSEVSKTTDAYGGEKTKLIKSLEEELALWETNAASTRQRLAEAHASGTSIGTKVTGKE